MVDLDQKTVDVVNILFEKIVRIKPAFKQAWPTEYEFNMVKREWISSFKRNNINCLNQIKKGLDRLMDLSSSFIPSPGEFINLCKIKPEDINAPSVEDAYSEACIKSHPTFGNNKNWSHKVVQHACNRTASHWLRTESRVKTFPAFAKNYEIAIELAADNKILDQIETNKTLENYQEYVAKLKSDITLGLKAKDTTILNFNEWANH